MAMIYLIRHGQASFLKHDYDKLSDLGVKQSELLGQSLKQRNQEAVAVVRGDLTRHQETAIHCLKAYTNDAEVHVDGRWNEYDHMELLAKYDSSFTDYVAIGEHLHKQDHPMRTLQQLLNASITDWINQKHPYSRSWEDFKRGAWEALNELGANLGSGESAWVFSSAFN